LTNPQAPARAVSAVMHHLRSGRGRKLIYAAIFVASFATYASRAIQSGRLAAPPENGDPHDYDAIAVNLWKLRGYGYYWSDPEYRAPYEGSSGYRNLLRRQSGYYPTAYRPPALPVLLSVVYAATDRNFAAWRLVNCAIVAGAVTLAAAIAAHFAGLLAAPLCAFLVLQSPQLTRFSHLFMTEGIATFLVSLLAYLWVANSRRRWTTTSAAKFGLTLGALLGARSIFVLWAPLALCVPPIQDASGVRRRWLGKAVCVVCCLLVIGPWWVRNIIVTKSFLPAGTQASLNLLSGFGPRALKYQGQWRSDREAGVEEMRARNVDPFSIEYEVQLGKIRSAMALQWMREHPRDVLRLMVLHIWQEVRPRGRFLWDWLLPAACVALLYFRRSPGAGAIALMLSAQLLSVAMTWGAGGRFMVPVQPLLLALVCAMVVAVLARTGRFAVRRLEPYRQTA
jgi:hypothetical protein